MAEALCHEAIARPALVHKLQGRTVPAPRRLKRNVSLHAARCPRAAAPLAEWRQAQREARLEVGVARAVESESQVEMEICTADYSVPTRTELAERLDVAAAASFPMAWSLEALLFVRGAGARHVCERECARNTRVRHSTPFVL